MSFCGKRNDFVAGSSSSGWRGGEEENSNTVCTLREKLYVQLFHAPEIVNFSNCFLSLLRSEILIHKHTLSIGAEI
jgi:hypothetical protein